ncbi:MAG: hypothetical protein M1829_006058 [Trizodia sp. TS-e1964]|nr:MAG: hypothetical protein M1829_006058 [Trizodia sp. TS-e1964]
MILQAFKIVTRGVRFLDIWNDEVGLTQMEEMLDVDTRMDGADDASPLPDHQQHQQQQQQHQHHLHHVVPPTPPAETTSFEHLHHQYRVQYAQEVVVEQPELEEIASRSPAADSNRNSNSNFHCSPFPPPRGLANTTSQIADEPRKLFRQSASYMPTTRPVSFSRRPMSLQIERNSASHRVSYTGRTAAASPSSSLSLANNLASERLSATHDVFLSYLASFIGRLHLQSRSISELLLTTKQSVTSGRDLLAVVDAVCERAQHRAESLEEAKDHMFHRITELVQAAREAVRPPSAHEDSEDVIVADHGRRLMNAATDCVKASGDCVAKTKFVIERIGDFEFEPLGRGLDIPTRLQHVESASEVVEVVEEMEPHGEPEAPMPAEKDLPEEASAASIVVVDVDKPLPLEPPMEHYRRPQPILLIPDAPATNMLADRQHSPTHALFPLLDAPSTSASTIASNRSSITSSLPPLTCLGIPLMDDTTSPKAMSTDSASPQTYGVPDFRTDSIGVASTATSTAYLGSMRDSEATMASQTSTRATTPDAPMAHPLGNQMMAGSQTTLAGDSDEGEANILEKTFAHELLFNKDGQITGGTLPALIERLTTHHSTPDSTFVSTFYLTFRLFATPADFATTLIERFDYVAESPHIAAPVRLRVYNVFKGWLESHWRPECDEPSLEIIQTFARGKLQLVLPSAGRRLSELAEKVSSVHGPLVPRLVSSIGKTSTSIAQYISPDTPMPAPILSKSQLNSLKSWKLGSNPNLCILDFDPLELARQFTLKESRIFCSILPEELLDSEWMKKSGSMAFNVRAMSTLSTDLANLVIDNILLLEEAKKRAAVIKQWVKIASKCLELNNYDSLMAIICSLNCSTILRLKKTWEAVSAKTKAKLENLKVIVDVSRNYHVLRQRLQNHVPPCLPFVGTYLTDLTFVDIGNPTHRKLPANGIHDGITVINFDKHMKTAKIIGELQRFQIPYRLNEIPEMQEWMQAQIVRVRSSDDTNVQNYYRRSLLLEPRESETPSQSQRPSPVEALYFNYTSTTSPSSATTKEASSARDKFDFLSWTGHARDKSLTTPS